MTYDQKYLKLSFDRLRNHIETFVPDNKSRDTALFDLEQVYETCKIALEGK